MRKVYITKGSKIDCLTGKFFCKSYDGTYVWGTFVWYSGHPDPRRYTLAEIALLMHETDGKNYKVYWED